MDEKKTLVVTVLFYALQRDITHEKCLPIKSNKKTLEIVLYTYLFTTYEK